MKILSVEDNHTQQEIIKDLILKLVPKCRIELIATMSKNDIKSFEGFNKPDLILLDWELSHSSMNGLQILKELKSNPLTREIPVIMCTGKADVVNIKKAMSYKVNGYIVKPLTLDKMKQCLDKFIETKDVA